MVTLQERVLEEKKTFQRPTSPSGSSFEFFQRQRNTQIQTSRDKLIQEGFEQSEVESSLPLDVRKPQPRSARQKARARELRTTSLRDIRARRQPTPQITTAEEFPQLLFERQRAVGEQPPIASFERPEVLAARLGEGPVSRVGQRPPASFDPELVERRAEQIERIEARTGQVQPVIQPIGLERARDVLQRSRQRLARQEGILPGLQAVGIGLGTVGVETAIFGRELIRQPVATIQRTGTGIVEFGRRLITGRGFPEAGRVLRQEPGFAIGVVGGELALGLGAGRVLRGARKAAIRVQPAKVDIIGTGLELEVRKTDTGRIISIPDIAFESRLAGTQFRGRGVGAAGITQEGLLGGLIKLEVEPVRGGPTTRVTTGVKGRARPSRKGVTEGITIAETTVQTPLRTEIIKTVTPFRTAPLVGGDLPSTVTAAGVLQRTAFDPLAFRFGTVAVTRKVAEAEGVSVFQALERGVSAPGVRRAFPTTGLGRRGELLPVSRLQFEPSFRGPPEGIFASQTFTAIRTATREARLAQVPRTRLIPVVGILPGVRTGLRSRIEPAIRARQITPIKPIEKQEPRIIQAVRPAVAQDVAIGTGLVFAPAVAVATRPLLLLAQPSPVPTRLPPITPTPIIRPVTAGRLLQSFGGISKEPQKTFNLEVRRGEKRGDKFVIAKRGLTRNRALQEGARIVDNFVEASFRIRADGRKTNREDVGVPALGKFRSPKGKTKLSRDTFVERRRHRIDTEGENLGLRFFREQRRGILI